MAASARKSQNRNRLYGRRWRVERRRFLAENPFCQFAGCRQLAGHVDHRRPHRGNEALFWDRRNWQGLCAFHHNSTKQAFEKAVDRKRGCDETGAPLDPSHPWYGR